jgi:hypothetical protein
MQTGKVDAVIVGAIELKQRRRLQQGGNLFKALAAKEHNSRSG